MASLPSPSPECSWFATLIIVWLVSKPCLIFISMLCSYRLPRYWTQSSDRTYFAGEGMSVGCHGLDIEMCGIDIAWIWKPRRSVFKLSTHNLLMFYSVKPHPSSDHWFDLIFNCCDIKSDKCDPKFKISALPLQRQLNCYKRWTSEVISTFRWFFEILFPFQFVYSITYFKGKECKRWNSGRSRVRRCNCIGFALSLLWVLIS